MPATGAAGSAYWGHMARHEPALELPGFFGAGAPAIPTARLRRAALRITRDAAAADDAVQSALEKALRHAAAFRGEAKPSTWLHRIVVNEALAWRRSEGRRARHARAAHEAAGPAAAPLPLDALLLRERRERVLGALAGLRVDQRELLARYALDGDYTAYARKARLQTSAAKTRAFRARRALRAALEDPAD